MFEELPALSALGDRICILGPSGSGKSTLAHSIGQQRSLPIIHLDLLHHLPGSNWKKRPDADFLRLHDDAIRAERWVMDGNYSSCLLERLTRATGAILLDVSAFTSLYRYFRRALFEPQRLGSLEGSRDRVNYEMLHHILVVSPKNRRRYAEQYRHWTLPKVSLPTTRALNDCYAAWHLRRPAQSE